jgi:septal ring factor EnvC (AmiA/AmiB activator)
MEDKMPAFRKNKEKQSAEEGNIEPAENKKVEFETPTDTKPAKKSPGFFVRLLRAIGIGVLLLALGAAALFFTVTQPRANELNDQIKTLQGNVSAAEAKVTEANTEVERLKTVESELAKAKSDIANLQSQLEKTSAKKSVYEIQSNVNAARIALLEGNSTRAEQSIMYLIQNLNSLAVPAFPDITKNLETRLTGIQTNITTDKTKALTDLEALFNDLVLLADNIK